MKDTLTEAHVALQESAEQLKELEPKYPELAAVLQNLGKAVELTLNEVYLLTQGGP